MNKIIITLLASIIPMVGYANMSIERIGDVSRNGFTIEIKGTTIQDTDTISWDFDGLSRTLPIPPELTKERQQSVYDATNGGVSYYASMTFNVFGDDNTVDKDFQKAMETGGNKRLEVQFGSDSNAIIIPVPTPEPFIEDTDIHISDCPYIPTIRAFLETEQYASCLKEGALKKLITRDLEAEINRYQVQLDRLYTESATVPEQLAKHSVYELRRHADCMDQICNIAFTECLLQPIGNSSGANRFAEELKWCYDTVDTMFTMAGAKTKNTFYRRQYRIIEVVQEKNAAIYKRLQQYILAPMTPVLDASKLFLRRLTGTIETPI